MPVIVYADAPGVLRNYGKALAEAPEAANKAYRRTFKEAERRANALVARRVSAEYTVKSADVKSPKTAYGRVSQGSEGVTLTYRGRTLTFQHFKYTPKARPKGRRGKHMTAAVKNEGGMKTLGPRAFIGTTGGRGPGKIQSIPFMRTGGKKKLSFRTGHWVRRKKPVLREPIKSLHGPSIPQMVANETEVMGPILEELEPYMQQRFEHHFAFYKGEKR